MALSIGKLTILVGAGILGSVLAKEGRMPSFSDVLSGALKVALKPIQQNDSASSTSKPKNDALIAQVNSLRKELQLLSSKRPITIVTSSTRGGRRYGVIIVVIVIGCGYVWWKGWKLPDMMFATKRSLADACNSVAKQLEQVFSSISATKRDLSSRLDGTHRKYDEVAANNSGIKEEAIEVRGKVLKFDVDIQSVNKTIQTLESRMERIQGKEDETRAGVGKLLHYAMSMEKSRFTAQIQASPSNASRPAIDQPQIAPSSRMGPLPVVTAFPSPSAHGSNEAGSLPPVSPREFARDSNGSIERQANGSSSGLKDFQGISRTNDTANSPVVSNRNHGSEDIVRSASSVLPDRKPNVKTGGFLSRTRSATQSFRFK